METKPNGIGGVRSLPDGIGQVLDMYLREKAGALPVIEEKKNGNGGTAGHKIEEEVEANFQPMRIGDLCPECGEAAVVNDTCAARFAKQIECR